MRNDLIVVDGDAVDATVVFRIDARTLSMYPPTLPRQDPELVADDPTTSWLVVMVLLLLMPPLGWLQLAHRRDMDFALRCAIAGLSCGIALAVWEGALNLAPLR